MNRLLKNAKFFKEIESVRFVIRRETFNTKELFDKVIEVVGSVGTEASVLTGSYEENQSALENIIYDAIEKIEDITGCSVEEAAETYEDIHNVYYERMIAALLYDDTMMIESFDTNEKIILYPADLYNEKCVMYHTDNVLCPEEEVENKYRLYEILENGNFDITKDELEKVVEKFFN